MCFQEFIGYACGHATIKILRPCPMTTHLYTNPICPNAAERPTQINSMCPSCARILHVRWVEIITLEHQWMHERGVCGCPVMFPALQEPRAVGAKGKDVAAKMVHSSKEHNLPGTGTHGKKGEAGAGTGIVDGEKWDTGRKVVKNGGKWGSAGKRDGKRKTKRREKGKSHGENQEAQNEATGPDSSCQNDDLAWAATRAKPNDAARQDSATGTTKPVVQDMAAMPYAMAWNTLAPMVEITQVDEERTNVAVRLSSLYGAEWIIDHGALHNAGKCNCRVSFDTYKPHLITEDDVDPLVLAVASEQLHAQTIPHADDMGWHNNLSPLEHDTSEGPVDCQAQALNYAPVEGYCDITDNPYIQVAPHLGLSYDHGNGSCMTDPNEEGSCTQSCCCAPYASYAHYTQGPYTQRSTAPTQAQAYVQAQPHDEIVAVAGIPAYRHQEPPLAGWPIGGGPEFGTENSHSPNWSMCQLSRPKLKKSRSWVS